MYAVGLDVDTIFFALVFTCKKILLYAGNPFSNYNSPLVFNTFGKICQGSLKAQAFQGLRGQSAGNFRITNFSQGKFNYTRSFNLPLISEHPPINKKDLTLLEFGYYLAGLIEGYGWFGYKTLHIIFHESDTFLAYYIKKRIGYGNIYKIKDKKAVRYVCNHTKGLEYILSLINGKLVSNLIYDQLILHNYSSLFNFNLLPPTYLISFNNHWLSGFTDADADADGCFHISIVKSKSIKIGYSVRLEYLLKQKDLLPLYLIYNLINKGHLSQYSIGIWCYKSTGYLTAYDQIKYFDVYILQSSKFIKYLKFRKAYYMITKGLHLTFKGLNQIMSFQSKGSSETNTQDRFFF